MFKVPQNQDEIGFQYRKGQEETINMILNGGPGTYLAVLPGGYGKTLTAIGAYYELRKRRICDRFLYIAPSSVKLIEFNHDLKKQCLKIGFNDLICNCGDAAITLNDAHAVKEHQYNRAEFFMVTPQFGINSRGHLLQSLLRTGNWFVCVDESHHYTDVNEFGKLIESLSAKYFLGLSATPHNQNQLAIFTKIKESNIYEVKPKDAIKEEAIRPIIVTSADYFVDILSDGNIITLTTEQLREEIDDNGVTLNQYEIKKGLRYLHKYVSILFIHAINKLDELNDHHRLLYISDFGKEPYRPIHQMLIFADTVSLAEHYCKMLNDSNRKGFADWIGTGINGRKSEINKEILLKYKNGDLPCLVQVSVAGEGFDNPQSSVIIYLSLQYNGNQVEQKIMRGMRRNYMIKNYHEDKGYIYVPTDSKALKVIKDLESLLWENISFNDESKINKIYNSEDFIPLPTYDFNLFNQIIDVLFNQWQTENLPEKVIQQIIDETKRSKILNVDSKNDEHIKEVRKIIEIINQKDFPAKKEELTREELKKQIQKLIGRIAYTVTINTKRKHINGTAIGDMIKAINSKFVYDYKINTNEMTYDELLKKLDWCNNLSKSINESKILPIWLQR